MIHIYTYIYFLHANYLTWLLLHVTAKLPSVLIVFQLGKWRRRRYDGIVLIVQLGEGHFESASIPKLLSQHISPKKNTCNLAASKLKLKTPSRLFFSLDSLEVFVHDEGTFSAQVFSGKKIHSHIAKFPLPSGSAPPDIPKASEDDDTYPQFPDASVTRRDISNYATKSALMYYIYNYILYIHIIKNICNIYICNIYIYKLYSFCNILYVCACLWVKLFEFQWLFFVQVDGFWMLERSENP